jgi:multidrug efflux system membrane fusion protein
MIRGCRLHIVAVYLLMTLAVAGCGEKKPAKREIPPRPVSTAIAATKDVPDYLDSFGNLNCLTDVNIMSQVTGEIKEAYFTGGQDVKKGDPLFLIDPAPYKAQLEKAEAALAADTANLALKKVTFERNKKLLERQLISQQDFDQYKTDVEAGEAQVNLDKALVDLAKINLDYCYINSPMDGRTGKQLVDIGNIVTANSGPTLVNIKTIDTLYMDFTIPETDMPRVRGAMAEDKLKVLVSNVGQEDYAHSGELAFFDNKVDNTTGTVLLRALINNKDRGLWSGQFANIRLVLGTEKEAVVVPYEAVQLGQNGSYVFVVDGQNKAELRAVETGPRCEGDIMIKKGVKAGEKVVTVGQMGLAPGVSVIEMKEG